MILRNKISTTCTDPVRVECPVEFLVAEDFSVIDLFFQILRSILRVDLILIIKILMNDLIIITLIVLVSLVLGLIKFNTINTRNNSWQLKFVEIWNDFFNFFIVGLIGYYFFLARLPQLLNGGVLNIFDFVLFIIFTLGLFGHLCVLSKNITDGIEVIFKRILER